jgi:hypothetical protein
MGVTSTDIDKNDSWTIRVGTYTLFSSVLISQDTMLPLIISSSKKTMSLVSTNLVSVRIVETKPLSLIQIANEMITYSLRV